MTGFEFFLYGLLKAAVTGAVAGAVIALVCLHWQRIVDWFQSRIALKTSDVNNVGFSLQERLANGDYRTVYGVFNTRTQQLIDTETVTSQGIDPDLQRVHQGHPLVVYPT